MGKSLVSVLCCLALVCAFTACSRSGNSENKAVVSLQIKGSDTMVNLGQAWAEKYTKLHPDVNIGVTGGGSGTGFASLLNKTCDIAMSSRSVEAKEIAKAKEEKMEFAEQQVGLDGLAVVVNPASGISKLTIPELRDIFMGTKTNWKDFGGKDAKIVLLSRESNSGTHVFFKEHVLKLGKSKGPEEFSPKALLMPSSQAISDEVAQNSSAIGYFGMGYISKKHTVIAVAKDKKSEYLIPTMENVKTGKYPISRPLFLCVTDSTNVNIKSFLDFAVSAEGQAVVKELDFVPFK